jgi:hypothetical protein
MKFYFIFVFIALASITSISFARLSDDPSPISCSIDGIADYSRTLHFCDLMKQARKFGSAKSPYDGNCSVGVDKWPNQDSFGVIFITLPQGTPPVGVMIDGVYTLTFIGKAELSFPVSSITLLNQTYDPTTDSSLAYLSVPPCPINNGQVWIGFTNAIMRNGLSGLKNISLLQPGCFIGGKVYSPPFLSLLSRFNSLRFMDLLSTNGKLESNWNERRLITDPTFASNDGNTSGIPWEYVALLANEVQRDIWINIPAHASDDYIIQIAQLLLANVDPSLYIYYEYSNEVWNWQFEQATYNLKMANTSVVIDNDPYNLNYDMVNNTGYWAWRRTAYMCKHIADLFKTVFGNDQVGNGKRVRPILSGQVSYPAPIEEGLQYIENVFGPPADFFHAIAGAPYFGIGGGFNNNANLTIDNVFQGFDIDIAEEALSAGVTETNPLAVHVSLAYHYGLQMRAYEGGPDTSGPNLGQAYLEIKGNATLDPRIQTRVETYLNNWYQYGRIMGPLNYFVAGASDLIDQYGVYGILFDMRLPNLSYKLQAVDAVRVLPKPATPVEYIPTLPVTLNCTYDQVGARRPVSPPYHCDYFGANTTFDFFFQVSQAGPINAIIQMCTTWLNATISVQVNNDTEVIVPCPPTPGGYGHWSNCNTAQLNAPQGVSIIRLRSIGWESTFRTYSIANITLMSASEDENPLKVD